MTHIYSIVRSVFIRNERLSLISVGGFLVLSVVLMGLVSLTSLNDKAMKGYMLNDLESQRQALVTDGEITEMLSLRARSISVIEAASQGMVKPGSTDIVYVQSVSVVAVRD